MLSLELITRFITELESFMELCKSRIFSEHFKFNNEITLFLFRFKW